MTWNKAYFDALNQIYWSPKYIGFRSIGQTHWRKDADRISVPSALVNPRGPLYSRERNQIEQEDYLLGQEEILNQVFNITFAIVGDAILSRLFFKPFGFGERGPFASLGREIAARYGWSASENVTQPDGLFASQNSLIGIELKLDARSSVQQLAKYVAVLGWEEAHSGRRENIGLLYIVPENSIDSHWRHCGLAGPCLNPDLFENPASIGLKGRVLDFFENEPHKVSSISRRLKLRAISWSDLKRSILGIQGGLNDDSAGDQTLRKLLSGFVAQLEAHRKTGLESA